MKQWPSLLVSLLVCFGVAALGGVITSSSVESWYPTLNKPWFNPPAWTFGVAWTILFALMAVAAWRVWLAGQGSGRRIALTWFTVQLLLNLTWSTLFFGLQRPGLALVEIVVFYIAIVITARLFRRIDSLAGWLFTPYILWVAFAAVLNWSIWSLNT